MRQRVRPSQPRERVRPSPGSVAVPQALPRGSRDPAGPGAHGPRGPSQTSTARRRHWQRGEQCLEKLWSVFVLSWGFFRVFLLLGFFRCCCCYFVFLTHVVYVLGLYE